MIFGSSEHFIKVCSIVYWLFGIKTDSENTLVISTHGFVKKRSKVPENEITKVKQQRINYFERKEEFKKKKR